MFGRSHWQDPVILFASIRVLIDSSPTKCECNIGKCPFTKVLLKLIYNSNIFPAFRKVILSTSFTPKLKPLRPWELNFSKTVV